MNGDTLHDLAMRVRYDLTAAQTKLTALMQAIDAATITRPDPAPTCPTCGTGGNNHTHDCPEAQ